MTAKEVLAELEALGTEQNRKIYARHGVPSEGLLGVSSGNLEKLRKRLRIDQLLAEPLWSSGIHDARILACKIADATAIPIKTINAWSRELRSGVDAGEEEGDGSLKGQGEGRVLDACTPTGAC